MTPRPPAPQPFAAVLPLRRASVALLVASDLRAGEEAVVASVGGTAAQSERLAALGLVPGTHLRVLRGGATLTLAVGETRLALGRAWARVLAVVRC